MSQTLGADPQVTRYVDCYRHIEHALGGPINELIPAKDIVDEAGYHLCNLHSWKWLQDRSIQLALRPKNTFTSATWTESTKTLSSILPVLTATAIEGDVVNITGGTGATVKQYEIDFSTTPTTTSIVLKESIGAAADALTDITGDLPNNIVALPPHLREVQAISATDAVINGLRLTTMQDLVLKRTSAVDVSSSWNYYGAVGYAGEPPRPVLEVWPTTTDADPKAFTMFYRTGWCPGDNDTSVLPIPPFMRSCMFRLVRIFAMGYEEGDESEKMSLDMKLNEFQHSEMVRQAMERDGSIQPNLGPLRGGAVQSMPRGYRNLLSSNVDAPT